MKTAKVRPFVEYVSQEPGFGAVTISGRILQGCYVIQALETQATLETVEVGEDEWGVYAVVRECDVPFINEFRLRLEVDGDTMLNIYIPGQGVTGTSNWADRSFRIWFNTAGVKDGSGSTLRGEDNPTPPVVN